MADNISHYLKKHTKQVVTVVLLAFLVLAAGEYYLLRQIQHINRQLSEGLIQLKEMR